MKKIIIKTTPQQKGRTLDYWQKMNNDRQVAALFALFFCHCFIKPII